MDDDYKRAEHENLRNPKNRFFGIFCHAKEVDETWGCGCSFATGVLLFAIINVIASFFDIYYMASRNFFKKGNSLFKFMAAIKILSNLISFLNSLAAIYEVKIKHYVLSIVCYYLEILSFFLNSFYFLYCIVAIFSYFDPIGYFIISWGAMDFIILLFCWILFCNQVVLGRERRQAITPQS